MANARHNSSRVCIQSIEVMLFYDNYYSSNRLAKVAAQRLIVSATLAKQEMHSWNVLKYKRVIMMDQLSNKDNSTENNTKVYSLCLFS